MGLGGKSARTAGAAEVQKGDPYGMFAHKPFSKEKKVENFVAAAVSKSVEEPPVLFRE